MAGFHVSALISPWATLEGMVTEFLKARAEPSPLQIFVNCSLGEPWEESSERLDSASLIHRAEVYDRETIPAAAMFLTCGVDVQGDRLEASLFGWGAFEESWLISHEVILGDPVQQSVWRDLDTLLLSRFRADAGHEMRIRAACIDTGGGQTRR